MLNALGELSDAQAAGILRVFLAEIRALVKELGGTGLIIVDPKHVNLDPIDPAYLAEEGIKTTAWSNAKYDRFMEAYEVLQRVGGTPFRRELIQKQISAAPAVLDVASLAKNLAAFLTTYSKHAPRPTVAANPSRWWILGAGLLFGGVAVAMRDEDEPAAVSGLRRRRPKRRRR